MTVFETLQHSLGERYILDGQIGEGGMATVYLAQDVKHQRRVALKVLKPEFGAALGAERFLAEIRVTAQLQHPNILPLFDSGEADGLLFYVMPFVEGETLRKRLDREKQLSVEEAVRIAACVATALEYAHARGVIHRDLKPENILIQAEQPMIADFGIALAVSNAGGDRLTATGLSLGTPQYMSPEQAAGERAIDGRTDIYSLGAVTYEMLAGEPPHSGATVHAVIAKSLTADPLPLHSIRPKVPFNVEGAVNKALAKVPADRFTTARAFADALSNPAFGSSEYGRSRQSAADRGRYQKWFYASVAVTLLIAVAAVASRQRTAHARPLVRHAIALGPDEMLRQAPFWENRLAISPDGSHIVYVGGPNDQLLLRSRDQLQATPLRGTEGARSPFFSPDGNRIGFLVNAAAALKIASLDGNLPVTVTDSMVGYIGASWGADGYIYANHRTAAGLVRVRADAGATPQFFTKTDTAAGEKDYQWPDVLPNGKGVLFTVVYRRPRSQQPAIGVAEVATGKHKVLIADAIYARYAAPGYIIYLTTARKLMAVRFDQDALDETGAPIPLNEDPGSTDLAVSTEGTLTYETRASGGMHELVWVSRDGKLTPVDSSWRDAFEFGTLSRDGTHLAAVAFTEGTDADIWIKDLRGGPATNLTVEGGANWFPNWTRDGRSLTYASPRASRHFDLWTRRVDGTGEAVRLLHWKDDVFESTWSPDRRWLIFSTSGPGAGPIADIFAIRPGLDSAPTRVARGGSPSLSPDGRYLTYVSNESGRNEIYVAPFPNSLTAKWLVSTHGGSQPLWSHSGRELFYRDLTGGLVSVTVRTTPTFAVERSIRLFSDPELIFDGAYRQYDVSQNDQRFLMVRDLPATGGDKLVVVENWVAELNPRTQR